MSDTPIARRKNQPEPTTAEEAEAVFKCQAYECSLVGRRCAEIHLRARETRQLDRDACIACPAGAARAKLLGLTVASAVPSRTPPGKAHWRDLRRGEVAELQAAGKLPDRCDKCGARCDRKHTPSSCAEVQAKMRAAEATTTATALSAKPMGHHAPPAVSVLDAPRPAGPPSADSIGQAAEPIGQGRDDCARENCDRTASCDGQLPEFCARCAQTGRVLASRSMGRASTVAEQRAWLMAHHAIPRCRPGTAREPCKRPGCDRTTPSDGEASVSPSGFCRVCRNTASQSCRGWAELGDEARAAWMMSHPAKKLRRADPAPAAPEIPSEAPATVECQHLELEDAGLGWARCVACGKDGFMAPVRPQPGIVVTLPGPAMARLDALLSVGCFGASREEAISRIVCERLAAVGGVA